MKLTTLCFLTKGDDLLLAMKKRGFGINKWNGIGGKVMEGEAVKTAALRELQEEVGVTVKEDNLLDFGEIKFVFNEHPEWNQVMSVFMCQKWEGVPQETEEMAPMWYSQNQIPYTKMWWDDPYWLPQVLKGKRVKAEFHFVGEGEDCDYYEVRTS